jgi:hypothetical protein
VPIKQRAGKELRAQFRREALELFVELEGMRGQHRQEFKDKSKRLARLLGLTREFWGGNSVLDRDRRPCWPPSLVAHHDWYRVREVREQLLAAAGLEYASARRKALAKHPAPLPVQ